MPIVIADNPLHCVAHRLGPVPRGVRGAQGRADLRPRDQLSATPTLVALSRRTGRSRFTLVLLVLTVAHPAHPRLPRRRARSHGRATALPDRVQPRCRTRPTGLPAGRRLLARRVPLRRPQEGERRAARPARPKLQGQQAPERRTPSRSSRRAHDARSTSPVRRRHPDASPPRSSSGRSTNFEDTIEIDKGTDDGIKVGMPVVTGAGLVGRIVEVHGGTRSVVQLLTDPDVRRRRAARDVAARPGVHGHGDGQAAARSTQGIGPKVARAAGNELVTTSGWTERFPPEIPVGNVMQGELSSDQLTQVRHVDAARRPRQRSRSSRSLRLVSRAMTSSARPAARRARRARDAADARCIADLRCGARRATSCCCCRSRVGIVARPRRGRHRRVRRRARLDLLLQARPSVCPRSSTASSASPSACPGDACCARHGGSRWSPRSLASARRRRGLVRPRRGRRTRGLPRLAPGSCVAVVVAARERGARACPSLRVVRVGRVAGAAGSGTAGRSCVKCQREHQTRHFGSASSASSSLSLFAALFAAPLVPPGHGDRAVQAAAAANCRPARSSRRRPAAASSTATATCSSTTASRSCVTVDRRSSPTSRSATPTVQRLLDRLRPSHAVHADQPIDRAFLEHRLTDPRYSPYLPVPVAEDVPKPLELYLAEHHDDVPRVVVGRRRRRSARTRSAALRRTCSATSARSPQDELDATRASPKTYSTGRRDRQDRRRDDLRGRPARHAGHARCSRSTPRATPVRELSRTRPGAGPRRVAHDRHQRAGARRAVAAPTSSSTRTDRRNKRRQLQRRRRPARR